MFTDITETPRSRFLHAYRTVGWIGVAIVALFAMIAAVAHTFADVDLGQLLGLAIVVAWAAYTGGLIARGRAHPTSDGPALVSIGEALVQVAASIERMQNAVADLHKLDVTERAAASTFLMQAKGAVGVIRELAKKGGLTHSMIRAITPPLDDADQCITEAIDELSAVHWETEAKAVDEAASAVKH